MAICRVEKNGNYTVMSNRHLRDTRLSLKAIGLLSKVLSLPENWDYSVQGLSKICKENSTAIESALKELKVYGYLVMKKYMPGTKNEVTGEIRSKIEYEYIFYEQPQERQDIENLVVENRQQIIKEKPNTEKPNTEEYNGPDKQVFYVSETSKNYGTRPKRNYTVKPIVDVQVENKRLTRQQKHMMKIQELLEVVPKNYSQELIDVLGQYLDMRINLHIGKIDRAWFEKEWDEHIYPALEKYSEKDIVSFFKSTIIPKQYKRCFINISGNVKSNFNDTKTYTTTELERDRVAGTLAVEQAKRDGTYQREF